jgi:hypothetical protein
MYEKSSVAMSGIVRLEKSRSLATAIDSFAPEAEVLRWPNELVFSAESGPSEIEAKPSSRPY